MMDEFEKPYSARLGYTQAAELYQENQYTFDMIRARTQCGQPWHSREEQCIATFPRVQAVKDKIQETVAQANIEISRIHESGELKARGPLAEMDVYNKALSEVFGPVLKSIQMTESGEACVYLNSSSLKFIMNILVQSSTAIHHAMSLIHGQMRTVDASNNLIETLRQDASSSDDIIESLSEELAPLTQLVDDSSFDKVELCRDLTNHIMSEGNPAEAIMGLLQLALENYCKGTKQLNTHLQPLMEFGMVSAEQYLREQSRREAQAQIEKGPGLRLIVSNPDLPSSVN